MDPPVLQAMAKLLLLLASDCEISCIVPYRYHHHILQTCAAVKNNMPYHKLLTEMNQYGMELSNVLLASKRNGFENQCVEFVRYLVDQVVAIHANDRNIQPAVVIPESYNPEKGTAYYFTEHGNQIRKQPEYDTDKIKKKL